MRQSYSKIITLVVIPFQYAITANAKSPIASLGRFWQAEYRKPEIKHLNLIKENYTNV